MNKRVLERSYQLEEVCDLARVNKVTLRGWFNLFGLRTAQEIRNGREPGEHRSFEFSDVVATTIVRTLSKRVLSVRALAEVLNGTFLFEDGETKLVREHLQHKGCSIVIDLAINAEVEELYWDPCFSEALQPRQVKMATVPLVLTNIFAVRLEHMVSLRLQNGIWQ